MLSFKVPWFITVMGTGISSSILYNFAYEAHWLRILSYIMFGICSICLLWTTILFAYSIRRAPDFRHKIFFDLNHNVFIGCYAMGYTSWLNYMNILVGEEAPIFIYVLWWISNIFSLFTAWIIFFCILQKTEIQTQNITPTLLLPLVSLTVTSSSGGVITPNLPHELRMSTMIISFFLWANAMVSSFIILTIYFHRVLIEKLPIKAQIFTSFIPIGFLGQGAYSIQLFGKNYHDYVISQSGDSGVIEALIFQYTSVLAGMFLEAMGICVIFLAVASVLSYGNHHYHFGWWAMTFPLGTMCLAFNETYAIMEWKTFRVLSAILGVIVVMIVVMCLLMSSWDVLNWAKLRREMKADEHQSL